MNEELVFISIGATSKLLSKVEHEEINQRRELF